MEFSDFQLNKNLQDALTSIGFKKPTPIQQMAIPVILSGKDLVACAQTGTGKTAAYALPVIHKISEGGTTGLNTLIIVPTRELAVQIDQAIEGFSFFSSVSSFAVYGGGDGGSFERERKALSSNGADIVIATPGKLITHLNQGYVKLESLKHLILDEADRMLDMGFHDDIMRIISYLPKERQTLLFSATMPGKIRTLASKILNSPEELTIALSKPATGITQKAYLAFDNQKYPLLKEILKDKNLQSIIIFASTKDKVKQIAIELNRQGLPVAAIHSDLEQDEREEVLRSFKNKQIQILVATDILSRGIDIESISMVINFDVPADAEEYVHRIGRTARAESTGEAITLVNEKDQRKLARIEKLIQNPIPREPLPEQLGEGPTAQEITVKKKRSNKKPFFRKKKKNNNNDK